MTASKMCPCPHGTKVINVTMMVMASELVDETAAMVLTNAVGRAYQCVAWTHTTVTLRRC